MCNEVGHFLEPIACGPRVVPRVGDSGGQNPSRHSPIFPPPPLPSPPVVTAGQARAGDGGGGGIPSLSWIGGGRGTPRCTWERLSVPAATARRLCPAVASCVVWLRESPAGDGGDPRWHRSGGGGGSIWGSFGNPRLTSQLPLGCFLGIMAQVVSAFWLWPGANRTGEDWHRVCLLLRCSDRRRRGQLGLLE